VLPSNPLSLSKAGADRVKTSPASSKVRHV
jgi:hypothetical protein